VDLHQTSTDNGHVENNSHVDVEKMVMTVHQEQGIGGNRQCPIKKQGIMRDKKHNFISGEGTKYATLANRSTAIANILALCPNVAQ
jgi:hypothetical protein